jgi:uncharacterized protein (TIGR02285 family)
VHAKELTIGVPEWKGYTNADGTGVYFDLLRQTFPDDTFNIKIDSYNRTLANFHKNKLDIIVGVFREDIKQGVFPLWHLDIEAATTAFYDPTKIQLTHLSDLEDLTVSWLRGYKFNNFIPYVTSPYLVNTLETGFELVTKNRVNVFIDYPYNVPTKYQQTLASLEVMPSRHIYVAFQNNTSGLNLANQYDKMMPLLRDSGVLADVYSLDYALSQFEYFDPNKEKFIIETSVTKKKSRAALEPIESKVLDLLIEKNERYNIELQVSPLQPKHEQPADYICYSNKLKTESRLQQYIFSKPMTLYMGLRLFSKHKLTTSEPVDIALLLQSNPNKNLATLKERSYTDYLDNLLSSLLPEQVDYLEGDVDAYLTAFNTDEVDFIIEYPSTISNSTHLSDKDQIFSYPIKGANNYNLGHIMCKNTPSNKQFINDINKTLSSLYSSQYFINILYLEVDENSQKDFYNYYDEAFNIK